MLHRRGFQYFDNVSNVNSSESTKTSKRRNDDIERYFYHSFVYRTWIFNLEEKEKSTSHYASLRLIVVRMSISDRHPLSHQMNESTWSSKKRKYMTQTLIIIQSLRRERRREKKRRRRGKVSVESNVCKPARTHAHRHVYVCICAVTIAIMSVKFPSSIVNQ